MKKFLFDTHDFDAPEVVEDLPVVPTFSEAELEQARRDAEALGRAAGRAEAAAEALQAQEEKIRILLDGVTIALGRLAAGEDRRETEKCVDAARIALRVIHKMMPQLAATHGLPEVERIIAAAIEARREEPRIAITVATALLEPLKARIDAVAQGRGFTNKIIILADDTLGPSDCRVEWADGGSERLVSRLLMQIEGEFSRTIAGLQGVLDKHDEAAAPQTATDTTPDAPQEGVPETPET